MNLLKYFDDQSLTSIIRRPKWRYLKKIKIKLYRQVVYIVCLFIGGMVYVEINQLPHTVITQCVKITNQSFRPI